MAADTGLSSHSADEVCDSAPLAHESAACAASACLFAASTCERSQHLHCRTSYYHVRLVHYQLVHTHARYQHTYAAHYTRPVLLAGRRLQRQQHTLVRHNQGNEHEDHRSVRAPWRDRPTERRTGEPQWMYEWGGRGELVDGRSVAEEEAVEEKRSVVPVTRQQSTAQLAGAT